MIYYILLGLGQMAAGYYQKLDHVLIAAAILAAFILAMRRSVPKVLRAVDLLAGIGLDL